MSEVDHEQNNHQHQNFHLNNFIARHHQQQQPLPPFHHNPSASTMLYNNYYHPETPLPPLPSFFHPSATPSTKAFQSFRDVVLHHNQHPHQAKIRVRNFPKEVGEVEEEKKSHFYYHERDRLIREHQHEQQIKRSRTQEQQEIAPSLLLAASQPSFMEGCSNVVVNGGDNEVIETKNYHSSKEDNETSNLMYTNSSGQHNRFLMVVKGESNYFCLLCFYF